MVRNGSIRLVQIISLDADGWRSNEDFYSALLPKLGAPVWHGHNLDALRDSLSGDINSVEPPFTVEIANARQLTPEMDGFLARVAAVFQDAREEFNVDVSFKMK